jgi:hypothetical protein
MHGTNIKLQHDYFKKLLKYLILMTGAVIAQLAMQISTDLTVQSSNLSRGIKCSEICALLGTYEAYSVNFHRRFGTTYRFHF